MVAHDALRHHPEHHLEPGYRYSIYAALGPHLRLNGLFAPLLADTNGVRRRVCLSSLATRKVLPLWDEVWAKQRNLWPDEYTPRSILAVVEGIWQQLIDREVAGKYFESAREELNEVDYLTPQGANFSAAFWAAESAFQTLAVALFDEIYEAEPVNYNLIEQDIDPWPSETAHCAWRAYSGWWQNFDAAKSLEFWQWWLDEAVPAAWNSVPE